MRFGDIPVAIQLAHAANVNVCFVSHRGMGKSTSLERIARELGFEFLMLNGANLPPEDVRGYPWANTERMVMEYLPPADIPIKGRVGPKGIWFWDELGRFPTEVQNALLKALTERVIGNHELEPGWIIVAATNPWGNEEYTQAGSVDEAFLDRFAFITLSVDPDYAADWSYWLSAQTDVDPEDANRVIAAVNFNHKWLGELSTPQLGFEVKPSPRSIHAYLRVTKQARILAAGQPQNVQAQIDRVRREIAMGLIGPLYSQLDDFSMPLTPDDVLAGKATAEAVAKLKREELVALMMAIATKPEEWYNGSKEKSQNLADFLALIAEGPERDLAVRVILEREALSRWLCNYPKVSTLVAGAQMGFVIPSASGKKKKGGDAIAG